MKNYYCPECAGDIDLGNAIDPIEEYLSRYISPVNYKNIEVINVYKCKNCGYSCDDLRDILKTGTSPFPRLNQ
jgi:rubredoxin